MNVKAFFAKLDGTHTDTKACQHCNANMDIKIIDQLIHMTISHDDNCPLWIIIQAESKQG